MTVSVLTQLVTAIFIAITWSNSDNNNNDSIKQALRYPCKIVYQINLGATLHRFFSKKGITIKYRVYLIKFKCLTNFGWENEMRVKKTCFMTTEIDPIGEK